MPSGYLLQRIYDAVAHLPVERHELTCVGESAPGRRRIDAAVLSGQETTGQGTPDQNADVMVLGERLELVFETSANEAVIHLRGHISLQPQPLLQHDCRG